MLIIGPADTVVKNNMARVPTIAIRADALFITIGAPQRLILDKLS